jgi:hypothetical protein
MSLPRWRINLRRVGRIDPHYAQTLKLERSPCAGDKIVVRDIDGSRVTAIVRSFENRSRPKSRFEIYAVDVDEVDGSKE